MKLSDHWLTVARDYDIQEVVGSGSFGQVVKAQCRSLGVTVAIKHLTDFIQYDYDCLKILREIQLLKQIHATAKAGACCFIPELLDVVVPDG